MLLQSTYNEDTLLWKRYTNGTYGSWKQIAFTDSNVASATKLETSRKLWGNDFNGTSDVNGSLEISSTGGSYNEGIRIHPASNGWGGVVFASSDNTGSSGTTANTWGIHNNEGRLILSKGGTSATPCLTNIGGNWGIDTYTPAYKFDINGIIRAEKLIGTATGITETSRDDEEFTYQATPVQGIADGYRIDRIKGNTIVSDGELINNSAEAIETEAADSSWTSRLALGLGSIKVKDSNGNILEFNGLAYMMR